MLEQLIGKLIRLDHETILGVGYDRRVSDVSGYGNGYKPRYRVTPICVSVLYVPMTSYHGRFILNRWITVSLIAPSC